MTASAAYHRLTAAHRVLTEAAADADGAGLAVVLASDEMVLARMRAALAVVAADGLPVGPITGEAALVSAAVRWQRYARGPVTALHRDCAGDIARGLLRLWARERTPARRPPRLALRRARVELLGQARGRCAALRVDLREVLADTRRGDDFRAEVERRVAEVSRQTHEAVTEALAAAGRDEPAPPPAVPPSLPPPPSRAGGPENRLTLLLGAGFGAGAALAVTRLLGELVPAWSGAAGVVGVVLGLAVGTWVARTRRTLADRAVLDRWVGESAGALRAALEEHISARMLAAEDAGERPGGRLTA